MKLNILSNKKIKIAIVGNPNSGKSTLFNALTGLNQKVANFPGVTVEKRTGYFSLHNSFLAKTYYVELIDLPGTYSLYPKSLDEQIPFRVLCDPQDEAHPDAVILIADATNLKRNLFLCSQIMDLKIPVILVLNMMDLIKARGTVIDFNKIEAALGIKVSPAVARKLEGIDLLKEFLINDLPVHEKDFIDCTPQ